MDRKTYTIVFTLVSTLANIIITLAIMVGLMLGVGYIYFKGLGKTEPGTGLAIAWILCFLGGLILGMFLFGKICGKVIDHFNLAPKLDPKILGKYLPNGKKNPEYEAMQKSKPKTNIPKSSLAVEDDQWASDIQNGISASEDLLGAQEILTMPTNDE